MNHNDENRAIPESNRNGTAYFTKLAEKYHVAKYVMIVVLAVMILFTAIFGSSELKSENFKYFFKKIPVCDSGFLVICSGVPTAIILPPASPPSGPKSII